MCLVRPMDALAESRRGAGIMTGKAEIAQANAGSPQEGKFSETKSRYSTSDEGFLSFGSEMNVLAEVAPTRGEFRFSWINYRQENQMIVMPMNDQSASQLRFR